MRQVRVLMVFGLLCLLGLMSVSGIHAQDAGDCTTAQLLQAQGALGDAQDALEDDDVSGALELIAEANDLLTECSGEQTSSGGGGSRGGSTGAPDIEIAQGDTKDFESEDGSYTFVYPDTWFLVVDLGDRTVAANTADASVEVMQENPNPGRGEFWVFITPFELGEVDDLTSFTEDLVSEVFPDEEITDVVEVEFQGPGGRRDVRRVAYTDLVGLDQRIILAEMNDGWWGVMFVRARENEIEDYMPEILVVASTLTRE